MMLRKYVLPTVGALVLLCLVFVSMVGLGARATRKRFEGLRTLGYQPNTFQIQRDVKGVNLAWAKNYTNKDSYCLPKEFVNREIVVTNHTPLALTSGSAMAALRPPVAVAYRFRDHEGRVIEGSDRARFMLVPNLGPAPSPEQPTQSRVPIAIGCPREVGDYAYTVELVQDAIGWQSDVVPVSELVSGVIKVRDPAAIPDIANFGLAKFQKQTDHIKFDGASEEDIETIKTAYILAANTLQLSLQRANIEDATYLAASPGSIYPTFWVRDLASIQKALLYLLVDKKALIPHWSDYFLMTVPDQHETLDWVEAEPYSKFTRDTGWNNAQVDQGLWLINSILDVKAFDLLPKTWMLSPPRKGMSKTRLDYMTDQLLLLWARRANHELDCLTSSHVADWGDVALKGYDNVTSTQWKFNETPAVCGIFQQALVYQTLQRLVTEVPEEILNKDFVAEWRRQIPVIREYAQKKLWQEDKGFFAIHRHLTPYDHPFDEDDIFALGGNVLAIQSGLATNAQRQRILATILERQKRFGASTVGAVLLPSYPAGTFENPIMDGVYEYQNGGQWDWYGCRAASLLYQNNNRVGFAKIVEIARNALAHKQFAEWYDLKGTKVEGSPHYRASAAEFVVMIHETILRQKSAQD